MVKQIHTGDTLKSTKGGLTFLIAGYHNGGWAGFTDNGVYMHIKQTDDHYEHVPPNDDERIMTIPAATWVKAMDERRELKTQLTDALKLSKAQGDRLRQLECVGEMDTELNEMFRVKYLNACRDKMLYILTHNILPVKERVWLTKHTDNL